jgi:PKD repeat protein
MTTKFPISSRIRIRLVAAALVAASALALVPAASHAKPINLLPTARLSVSPDPAVIRSPFLATLVTLDASASSDKDGSIVNYRWDLDGNGTYETNTGASAKVVRKYKAAGHFVVRVKVTDNKGGTATTARLVRVSHRPHASLAATPTTALLGDQVTYSAAGSGDLDSPVTYSWDLDGNGTFETSTGFSPTTSRSYASIGSRDVKVRVRDFDGLTADATVKVLIHRAPTAAFTVAPSPAVAGEQVTFDGSSSSDDLAAVARYEWDLDGDGTFETDTKANPTATHTYAQPGQVTVRLKVTDNQGVSDQTTRTLAVQAAPPPDTTAPRMRILTRRAQVSRAGFVSIRIACPATERSCAGRLALRFGRGARSSAATTKAFRLGGAQATTLRLHLSRGARVALRGHRTLRTKATATARDAAGNAGTSSAGITLRR